MYLPMFSLFFYNSLKTEIVLLFFFTGKKAESNGILPFDI